MTKDKQGFNVWKLVVALCILVAVIGVGACIGVFLMNKNSQDQGNNEDLMNIEYAMAGWEGEVADSTKAMILTENIKDRLNSESGFGVSDAISDYEYVYNNTDGELRVYVAIEYASYIYDNTQDLGRAVNILEEVQELVNGQFLENNYLNALCALYMRAGDTEKVEYYRTIISEKYPSGQRINLNRNLQDE